MLIARFAGRRVVQTSGLDAVGTANSTDSSTIELELLSGPREANYWDKVPEKVRKSAVEKAGLGGCGTDHGIFESGMKQKRRRRE